MRARAEATPPAPVGAADPGAVLPPAPVVAAAAVTVVAWASAFLAIRGIRESFEPGALALGRLGVGAIALTFAMIVRRRWVWPTGVEWLQIVLCGVAWFGGYNVALNAAEQRLDAGTAAMLVNVGPVLIALLAGVVLREGLPRVLVSGIAVAFSGVVLIGVATSRTSAADLTGVVLCLSAALLWAIGVTAQKPALRRLPALQFTALSCVVGVVACLPFAGALADDLAGAPAGAVAGVVYLGLVPTAVAFGTWAFALARMDAGRLGVVTYLVPPLTVLAAWPLLGEVPPPLALVGGGLALTGVALTRRRRRRR